MNDAPPKPTPTNPPEPRFAHHKGQNLLLNQSNLLFNNQPVTTDNVTNACLGARLLPHQRLTLLNISHRTLRRWRQQGTAPPNAFKLAAIAAGWLPWPGWEGFRMVNGRLWCHGDPHTGFTPGCLAKLPWLASLMANTLPPCGSKKS